MSGLTGALRDKACGFEGTIEIDLLLFIITFFQDKLTNLNTAGKHTVTPPGSDFSVYTEIRGLAAARDMVN